MNSISRNSTHKYHIWYRISHFRGGGLPDLDDLVGDDPTQTSEVKILMQLFLIDIKNVHFKNCCIRNYLIGDLRDHITAKIPDSASVSLLLV